MQKVNCIAEITNITIRVYLNDALEYLPKGDAKPVARQSVVCGGDSEVLHQGKEAAHLYGTKNIVNILAREYRNRRVRFQWLAKQGSGLYDSCHQKISVRRALRFMASAVELGQP